MAHRPHSPFFATFGSPPDSVVATDTPVQLEQLSELGMVFQSPTALPLGTRLAIGLHLCPDCDSATGEGEFLIVDGIVVECHLDPMASADSYSVTLLFEKVNRTDQARIRRAMGCCQQGVGSISTLGGRNQLPTFGPN